jgi:hypothetical protein
MQSNVSQQFVTAIGRSNKSVLELFEFYSPDEEVFEPQHAIKTYAKTTIFWGGRTYTRHVLSRSGAKRYLERDTNTVTVSFGTNSEEMVRFMTSYRIEGMWLQIRRISLDVPNESTIVFGGRCAKPDDKGGTITAKQEIGGGAKIPARKTVFQCPLTFKGKACLGGQVMSQKSAAYQTAARCDKSSRQCVDYGNFDNFGAFRFLPVYGNFTYTTTEVKRLLLFFTKKKTRTVSAPWSSVSDVNQDAVIPEVGGVTQVECVPLMHADTGTNVKPLQAVADGEIDGIFNVRQQDKQYLPNFINYQAALGKWGTDGQPASGLFTGAGKFSGTAWLEYEVTGSDPADANDASPTTVAVVRGRVVPLPDPTGDWTLRGWTDVGPALLRFYLTEMGRHPASQINNDGLLQAFIDCNEPVIDDTGFDQAILPQNVTGGVDFVTYALALGFGKPTVDRIALMLTQGKIPTGGYGQLVQAYYRYYNQQQPPEFISKVRRLRRRYTTNYVLTEQNDLKTFIYDVLLPSFNGYLIFDSRGRISVKVDKRAPGSYLLSSTSAGQSTLLVEDVTHWKQRLGQPVLLGAHLKHAEVRRVLDWSFSTFGNGLTVAVNSTGGLAINTSSATLTGGSATTPASALIMLSGTPADGQTVSLTIDGIPVAYPTSAGDDLIAIAGLLAATINGHPILRRYMRADWNEAQGAQIYLYCKAGVLALDAPLAHDHFDFEEVLALALALGSAGQQPYVKDSFNWPLAARQSSANNFNGKFVSSINDWAKLPISRDYEEHQEYTHSFAPEEVNLTAVDNAHQAARLLKIYGGKRRLCDWFCSFKATGAATLLDVGDLICVSHWTGFGEILNTPVVIEEITDYEDASVEITARLYRSDIYDDIINELSPVYLMPLDGSTDINASGNPPDNTGGTTGTGNSGGGGSGPDPNYPQDGLGTGGGDQERLAL